jgi:peptidoglycan/xylan/chitin deacetylase (PgdA/CDA1 family)
VLRSAGSRPLTLCYHAVTDVWEHALSVAPKTLERQVRFLMRGGRRPASAAEVVAGRGSLLHVTFDDAYRSVASVLPALERLRVPVTVFACTAYSDEPRPLAIPELAADAAAHPDELTTMGWDELRALAERGVEIGSHTVSHAHLTRLTDEEIVRELRDSRARIQDELGRACRFLAYPFGEDDERVHAAARDAGYEGAFALGGSAFAADPAQPNPHALPRVGIYRRDGRVRVSLKTSPLTRRALSRWR